MEKILSKNEVLQYFSDCKYNTQSEFLSEAAKLNLVKRAGNGYVLLKDLSLQDMFNVEQRMREVRKNYKNKNKNPESMSLDRMAKIIANSGQYKIENGKVYKLTSIWKEL